MTAGPRFVIAPDSFKGSARARDVAAALGAGLRDVLGTVGELIELPVADGGEGTVDVVLATGACARTCAVHGPLGDRVEATYAVAGDCGVIEMSSASGLGLAPAGVLRATTYGTGELVRAALDGGARRIILAIGGSATSDGGAGALAALGVRFLDGYGEALQPSPAGLTSLAEIDATGLDPRLRHVPIDVACDVTNPLLGPHGAVATYARQKGATEDDLPVLEAALVRFAAVAARTTGSDRRDLAGSGAAGGLGYGLAMFAGAQLRPGFPLVAEICGLSGALEGAAWCLTGEGSIDAQTLHGKVVDGIAGLARAAGVRVCAFGGRVDPAAEAELWQRGVVCLPITAAPLPHAEAMRDALPLIRAAAARFARLLRTV